MKIPFIIYGIYARLLNIIVPVKKKTWAFGSDYGQTYRESSKYLLEFMLKNHPEYDCFFVTLSNDVYQELKKQGIPCYMNKSLKGLYHIAQAECIFTTQVPSDIFFIYNKKNRKFFYIGHGMPFKRAYKALPKEIEESFQKRRNKITKKLDSIFKVSFSFDSTTFAVSTSDYLVPYIQRYYGEGIPVKVIGFPRNDGLFDEVRMSKEQWVDDIDGKFVVTYMPTHRDAGRGELTPYPFEDKPEIRQWMKDNNVVFIMKQHPNMASKSGDATDTDVFKDITRLRIDPQTCLYHTNVLISDYSSVWIDYLLFKRPLVFYYYDDYVNQDWGVLYDINDDPPGHICTSPGQLFEIIKKSKEDYDSMRPSDRIVHKYHKYVDGKSCERYYNEVLNCASIQ